MELNFYINYMYWDLPLVNKPDGEQRVNRNTVNFGHTALIEDDTDCNRGRLESAKIGAEVFEGVS